MIELVFYDPNGTPHIVTCDRVMTFDECIGANTTTGQVVPAQGPFELVPPECPHWAPPVGTGFALGVILTAAVVLHHWRD